jgi:large conductance mechanosensitive channel
MSFLQEFKAFALRGNVIDLAVAVVISLAFGKIITSLVDGIIMPAIGLILGGVNVTDYAFTVGKAVIKWGAFLQTVIDFTLIALSIFVVIKVLSSLKRKGDPQAVAPREEVVLLTQIRDLLQDKNRIDL